MTKKEIAAVGKMVRQFESGAARFSTLEAAQASRLRRLPSLSESQVRCFVERGEYLDICTAERVARELSAEPFLI